MIGAAAVILLAAALRMHRSGDLSLWLDEGLTVHFARLSWSFVLGLDGVYVQNPPLFYVLTKLERESPVSCSLVGWSACSPERRPSASSTCWGRASWTGGPEWVPR